MLMEPATSTPEVGNNYQQDTIVYHLKGHAMSCTHFLRDFYRNNEVLEENTPANYQKSIQPGKPHMEIQNLQAQIASLKCQLHRANLACKQAKNEVFTVQKELDLASNKISTLKQNKENVPYTCQNHELPTTAKISILTSQLMKSESSRELYTDATQQLIRFVKMAKRVLEHNVKTEQDEENAGDKGTRATGWMGWSNSKTKRARVSRNAHSSCDHYRIAREASRVLSSVGKLMDLDKKIIVSQSVSVNRPAPSDDQAVQCTSELTKTVRRVPPGTRTYRNLLDKEKVSAAAISTLV